MDNVKIGYVYPKNGGYVSESDWDGDWITKDIASAEIHTVPDQFWNVPVYYGTITHSEHRFYTSMVKIGKNKGKWRVHCTVCHADATGHPVADYFAAQHKLAEKPCVEYVVELIKGVPNGQV